ncbi:BURP domain-containing protein 5-like isoform X1 [Spinacia oleracea]|uniref:BURP domain-containing protein 5-like isoform X1 n=1 Tax=Spinacia oleracea TaxID=3562 RepID=A0ABM3RAF6_SPIOL|nr:BURP domain-containing protein 5-like isoform X1 [Spinacia oleracea]
MSYYKPSFVLLLVTFISIQLTFPLCSGAPSSPEEIYWKTKVGDIPMPKPLKDSLRLGPNERVVQLNSNYKQDFGTHEALLYVWGGHVAKTQIPQDGRVIYFKDDILSKVGVKMKLYFKKINNQAKFLPLHVAKILPTTSNKFQVILNLLFVNPKSTLAQDIELMMKKCEEKGVKGEIRNCVNSLEDMVDYVTSALNFGKNKLVVASTKEDYGILLEYTIQKVQLLGSHVVVCHKIRNPFAVFLCHSIQNTYLYNVSMVRANGKQTEAFAICHKDTSFWNPRHYAFEFLNTKPGGKPICHFVCAEAIVWYRLPKNNGEE